MTLLRLPGAVESVFFERIEAAFPNKVNCVRRALIELRGGKLSDSRFGSRMEGQGPRWEALSQLFRSVATKHGIALSNLTEAAPAPLPTRGRQLSLFEER